MSHQTSSSPHQDGKEKSVEHKKNESPRKKSSRDLEERLNAIYKNEDGALPDMSHITVYRSHFWLKMTILILFFFMVGSGSFWAYLFVFNPTSIAAERHVSLAISGSPTTDFGAPTTVTVSYANHSSQALTKSVLTVRLPIGFVYTKSSLPPANEQKTEWNLGRLEPGEQGRLTITGLLYGAERDTRAWRAFLSYQGAHLNSMEQESASYETTVVRNPYTLSVQGSEEVGAHSDTTYTISLTGPSDPLPTDIEIIPAWPEHISIISSTPALSKTQRWTLPKGTVSSSLTFSLTGHITETTEKTVPFKVQLTTLLPEQKQTLTTASSSFVSTYREKSSNGLVLAINGVTGDTTLASPGDTILFTYSIKNTTPDIMRDATLRLVIQTPSVKRQSIFNWAELRDENDGDVRGEQISDTVRQATITWNKKHLPALKALAPATDATLTFSLPIKKSEQFDLSSIKDRTISLSGSLSYTDASSSPRLIPLGRKIITLTPDLVFEHRKNSTTTTIDTATTHDATWVVAHSFGTLKNIRISAEVYPEVLFTEKTAPSAGIASYDPATKRLTWTISELPESVDVLSWPFTLSITAKKDTQDTLISKITVEAEDERGQKIFREAPSTPLPR